MGLEVAEAALAEASDRDCGGGAVDSKVSKY
jgi:hypothetical protein